MTKKQHTKLLKDIRTLKEMKCKIRLMIKNYVELDKLASMVSTRCDSVDDPDNVLSEFYYGYGRSVLEERYYDSTREDLESIDELIDAKKYELEENC